MSQKTDKEKLFLKEVFPSLRIRVNYKINIF